MLIYAENNEVVCGHCKAQIPYDEDKRVVCIQCGHDYGKVCKGPLVIDVGLDWETPMYIIDMQRAMLVIERLLELY